jgi:hypothetical protein
LGESYNNILNEIADLSFYSQGCINILDAEELQYRDFMHYYQYFKNSHNEMLKKEALRKAEQDALIVASVKAICNVVASSG